MKNDKEINKTLQYYMNHKTKRIDLFHYIKTDFIKEVIGLGYSRICEYKNGYKDINKIQRKTKDNILLIIDILEKELKELKKLYSDD